MMRRATFHAFNQGESWTLPLLISLLIHCAVAVLASAGITRNHASRPELLPIRLLEAPQTHSAAFAKTGEPQSTMQPAALPPPKVQNFKQTRPAAGRENGVAERPAGPALRQDPETPEGPKPPSPAADEPTVTRGSMSASPGGEAAGNGAAKGELGVATEAGRGGRGGDGTAAAGLGAGPSPNGRSTAALKTTRAAKPIQTVRAAYPPMALRMGAEGDVTLRIEVDPEGKVTNAQVVKSGGAAFDEEALKAVKQSRFEPAQQDGHAVAAEFTYIYRFRLQR
jgi:TonB family protein